MARTYYKVNPDWYTPLADQGISIREFARRTGINHSTITRMTDNLGVNFTTARRTARAYGEILGLSIDTAFNRLFTPIAFVPELHKAPDTDHPETSHETTR